MTAPTKDNYDEYEKWVRTKLPGILRSEGYTAKAAQALVGRLYEAALWRHLDEDRGAEEIAA